MNWYNLLKFAQALQGDGYTAQLMNYSNKGPLVIVSLHDGSERRCYFDILVGKWKPLD